MTTFLSLMLIDPHGGHGETDFTHNENTIEKSSNRGNSEKSPNSEIGIPIPAPIGLQKAVWGEAAVDLATQTIRSVANGVLGAAVVQAVPAAIGLSLADVPADRRMLRAGIMGERAEEVGAVLEVHSTIDGGTEVSVAWSQR